MTMRFGKFIAQTAGFEGVGAATRPLRLVIAAAAALLVAAGPANAAGTWNTTLKARDFNGDGLVDAYYDTVLNITWLYNFQPVGSPGFVTWTRANSWAATLNIFGVTGWRLPTIDPNVCDWYWEPQSCALGPNGKKSELLHLMYATLGGQGQTGPFTNGLPVNDGHWYGTQAADMPDRAWGTFWYAGHANKYLKTMKLFPWPVRNGDVGTPLP